MKNFIDEHQELLKTLLRHDVEFLIIGGYAVVFHGYQRTTGDIDLWLRPTNQNKIKLILALNELDFEKNDLDKLQMTNFEDHIVFSYGKEPFKVDFITRVNQVSFEEADQNKIVGEIDELKLPVINLRELVLTKINTGRKKDEADIEELQKISSIKKEK